MKLSVLMCVNNENPFLDDAINSVLNQTFQDFEFLIIANNCSDKLFEKLSSFKDEKIELHRTTIGQLGFNLNYGVNLSSGEYIVRMDADDICYKDRLLKTINCIEKSKADVYAFSCDIINEENEIIGERIMTDKAIGDFYFKCQIVHPTVAIKKSALIGARGYCGGFVSEDYELWVRMIRNGFKFHMSSEKVLQYRHSQFQARTNYLGYCEVLSIFSRELFLNPSFKNFCGVSISIAKAIKSKLF